jgi:hypothetical protein
MQQALRRSSLVPAGFVVETAFCDADTTVINVRPSPSFGFCPSCGTVSRHVRLFPEGIDYDVQMRTLHPCVDYF